MYFLMVENWIIYKSYAFCTNFNFFSIILMENFLVLVLKAKSRKHLFFFFSTNSLNR